MFGKILGDTLNFFDKNKRNLKKLEKISVRRIVKMEDIYRLTDITSSQIGVIEKFTNEEQVLISQLQEVLYELTHIKHKLLIVKDVSVIPKIIWEHFFIITKDYFDNKKMLYQSVIEAKDYVERDSYVFFRNFSAYIGNERYERIR